MKPVLNGRGSSKGEPIGMVSQMRSPTARKVTAKHNSSNHNVSVISDSTKTNTENTKIIMSEARKPTILKNATSPNLGNVKLFRSPKDIGTVTVDH